MSERGLNAFVLHRRAWRESSLLVELLTAEQGRIGALARGMTGKRSNWRACLQPFRPLTVFLRGKGELANLSGAEEQAVWPELTGQRLYCGFYLNEITLRLLARNDPHTDLFQYYREALADLPHCEHPGVPLRYFELELLAAIGFGLQLEYEADSGRAVEAGAIYRYDIEAGPRRSQGVKAYIGASLLALARKNLSDGRQRRDARLLLQQALAPHLGHKPLMSRQLMTRREE